MTTETISLKDFIRKHKIRFSCEWTDRNPNMDGERPMDHWKCRLRCDGRAMTIVFSMGVGLGGSEPTAEDVLNCLASDSASVENARDFADWCAELGDDTDSRRAYRTYKACERQAERLENLLLTAAYKELLWSTERL